MKISVDYPKSILDSKLFNSLKDPEMRTLIKEATLKNYKTGETILKEGEDGNSFYWISSGKIDITMAPTSPTSMPLVLSTLNPGDVLGEMVLLGFNKRAASAVTKTDAQLYMWEMQKCQNLFIDFPIIGYRLTRNLGHMVGERLIATNKLLHKRSELLDANILKALISS